MKHRILKTLNSLILLIVIMHPVCVQLVLANLELNNIIDFGDYLGSYKFVILFFATCSIYITNFIVWMVFGKNFLGNFFEFLIKRI